MIIKVNLEVNWNKVAAKALTAYADSVGMRVDPSLCDGALDDGVCLHPSSHICNSVIDDVGETIKNEIQNQLVG